MFKTTIIFSEKELVSHSLSSPDKKKIHGITTHQKAKVTGTSTSRRYRKRELNSLYWNLTLTNPDW
jgi:hypothetical protein